MSVPIPKVPVIIQDTIGEENVTAINSDVSNRKESYVRSPKRYINRTDVEDTTKN